MYISVPAHASVPTASSAKIRAQSFRCLRPTHRLNGSESQSGEYGSSTEDPWPYEASGNDQGSLTVDMSLYSVDSVKE